MFINGLEVKSNSLCLEKTNDPLMVHKNNTKPSYHKRIQKKWLKRFGYVMKPCMFIVNNRILMCHPSLLKELRKLTEGERGPFNNVY